MYLWPIYLTVEQESLSVTGRRNLIPISPDQKPRIHPRASADTANLEANPTVNQHHI